MGDKPISKSKNPGLAKLAKKKPELAKKFGYNPKRMTAKKGGRAMLAGGGAVGFTEKTVSTGQMPKKQERIQIAGYGKARK